MIHLKWVYFENGSRQPAQTAYWLSKKKFVYSNLIDTNALYVTKNDLATINGEMQVNQPKRLVYGFLRFSSKGVVLFSNLNLENIPSDIEKYGYYYGQYSFYRVTDNEIRFEWFCPKPRIFYFVYGTILDNGDIYIYKIRVRDDFTSFPSKVVLIYRKIPAKFTSPLVFPK